MPRQPKVELTQTELFFPIPITTITENIVKVVNKDQQKVSFKIRTNSKGRYCVRPASGFLDISEEMMIKFTLDPANMMLDGHAPDANTDDFFFMEVRFVMAGDDASLQEFWRSVPPTGDASTKIKLPCKYIAGAALPERMVLRNAVRPSPRNDMTPRGDDTVAERPVPAAVPIAAPAPSGAGGFVPLTRLPAKPANPQELSFVAEPFRDEVPRNFLKAFLTFKFPLPAVLFFMVLSFLAAFVEEDSVVTRFLNEYVLEQ